MQQMLRLPIFQQIASKRERLLRNEMKDHKKLKINFITQIEDT
jgi:hypothetical protein